MRAGQILKQELQCLTQAHSQLQIRQQESAAKVGFCFVYIEQEHDLCAGSSPHFCTTSQPLALRVSPPTKIPGQTTSAAGGEIDQRGSASAWTMSGRLLRAGFA